MTLRVTRYGRRYTDRLTLDLTATSAPLSSCLRQVARHAQHAQVAQIVRAAVTQRDEVIDLPAARLEHNPASLTLAMSSLETVLTIALILRVAIRLPVRVTFKPHSLVDLRLVKVAIVALRRPPTHQARARPCRALQMRRAARRAVRCTTPTDETRLRARLHRCTTPSQSAHALAGDPTRGKNGLPQTSQIRSLRFSCLSFVSLRSRATSSSCTSRSAIS